MIDPQKIFSISSEADFKSLALEIFKFQFDNNPVYRSFCDLLYVHPSDVKSIENIPFLPIQFFKTHEVIGSSNSKIQTTFTSSGTTGSVLSKHYITDLSIYETSFRSAFKALYGSIEDYVVLALIPIYL